MAWWQEFDANDSDPDHGDPPPPHPLATLADAYRETVLDCLQRAMHEEASDGEQKAAQRNTTAASTSATAKTTTTTPSVARGDSA
jgi:hypothetical protein